MIAVSFNGARKAGTSGIVYLGIAFVIILVDNVIYTMSLFGLVFGSQDSTPAFLVSDLIILLVFYLGAIRGR